MTSAPLPRPAPPPFGYTASVPLATFVPPVKADEGAVTFSVPLLFFTKEPEPVIVGTVTVAELLMVAVPVSVAVPATESA